MAARSSANCEHSSLWNRPRAYFGRSFCPTFMRLRGRIPGWSVGTLCLSLRFGRPPGITTAFLLWSKPSSRCGHHTLIMNSSGRLSVRRVCRCQDRCFQRQQRLLPVDLRWERITWTNANGSGPGGSLRTPFGAVSRGWLEFTFKAEYAYDYGMPQWVARIDHLLSPLELERLFLGRHKFNHFRVWYRDALSEYVRGMLLDSRSLSRPYLDRNGVEAIVPGTSRETETTPPRSTNCSPWNSYIASFLIPIEILRQCHAVPNLHLELMLVSRSVGRYLWRMQPTRNGICGRSFTAFAPKFKRRGA